MKQQIDQLIKKEIQFPSLPGIAVEILDIVNKDDAPLAQLGEVIAVDPALSAKMLKVANSSLFSGNREISNLKRAMAILGTNTIRSIALSFVISSDLCGKKQSGYCIDDFWRRAVISAVAAELLSKTLGHRDEDIFLTALLQDLGLLAMLLTKGESYHSLLDSYKDLQEDLKDLEVQQYGFDHQQVGYTLLAEWNLPETITLPIRHHHCPEGAPETHIRKAEILACASIFGELYTSHEASESARILQQKLTHEFDLDREQALQLLDRVAEQSREVILMFDLDPKDIKPYSQLLQQANAKLEKLNLDNAQIILELQDAKKQVERLVNKLQTANNNLKELVYQDGLTGLYNHRYLQEALDSELARANRYKSSVSLVLFDIDNFKQINDSYGHPAGDLVLMNIARAVNCAVRANDIVARFGGDEFAIILPATNAAGAKTFAENLRLSIEGIVTLIDGQTLGTTISAGLVTFTPADGNIAKSQLIDAADKGLYRSKRQGRNRVTVATCPQQPTE